MTQTHCDACRTELPPFALSCPACGSLVHAGTLKQLAAEADVAAGSGNLADARDRWNHVLTLLPPQSQQYAIVQGRITELTRRIEAPAEGTQPSDDGSRAWWSRGAVGIGGVALLLLSKLKFLLLGLTKASTFVSMFAFFGVYWTAYGWPLALGLVLSIYIHEMGHVAMLRKLGIAAGAPLFIPGMGAVVMLKQRVDDPMIDARIGLAGPLWGLGAGLAALLVYVVTGAKTWLAIAQLTGFINLFNLIPIWQLDGSRGFHALARTERWMLVAAVAVVFTMTRQPLLFIVGAVAVWRAVQRDEGPGSAKILATFATLIVSLSLLARDVG